MARSTGPGEVRPLTPDEGDCSTSYLLYNFDIDGSELKPVHQTFLRDRAHRILSNDARTEMRLVGRSSRSGADDHNYRLSERRVDAVRRFVIDLGNVADSQISSEALGERDPYSTARESADDRSVEVHFTIPSDFILALADVTVVRHTRVVEAAIRETLEPLVQRAGRHLLLGRRAPADVTLRFDRGGRESRPCGFLIFGNEGGGDIFVGAHIDLRVCGIPQRDPRTGHVNHAAQIERVFDEDEPDFARFVANTAVHEMGHLMGLDHVADEHNYMFSVGGRGANLPREHRTLSTMRRHWAGPKRFNPEQAQQLVCAMKSGFYPGGMRIRMRP